MKYNSIRSAVLFFTALFLQKRTVNTSLQVRCVPVFLLLLLSCFSTLRAAEVVLHTRSAVAWLPQQTIRGNIIGINAKTITIHHDSTITSVAVNKDHSFTFFVTLHDAGNRIWVVADNANTTVSSDTVILQLGYHPTPVVKPYAVTSNNWAALHAAVITSPWKQLHYYWTSDKNNPAPVTISNAGDPVAHVQIPPAAGIYYFHLAVVSGSDTAHFETFITRKAQQLQPFNMDAAPAEWINDAIIYEITPHAFVQNGTYDDITAKLPEIKSLGVNTIWLQPLFKNYDNSQGYEVTDYFSLRDDLGSEAQLQQLIQTAKSLGMRVLFDFVPNHTSVHHPYARDCAKYKTDSHYYNFYQHTNDGVLYSSNYHTDSSGFVYYFWDDLVNLNYSNKEVQQWIIEACKYWIKKFDIDGYRFDAVWGVNARQPGFGKRLQLELKVIKPDVLLLAEDKGAMSSTYAKGFDAAYDWTADTSWVSHWSWQYDYHPSENLTIFNADDTHWRGSLLRQALFNNGDAAHLRLRFIENNDLPRFIASMQVARTKMAAALTFALPGIPLIYNGQETGIATWASHKHATFSKEQSIQSTDKDSLFTFYQQLTAVRTSHPCLRSHTIDEIKVSPANVMVAFHRGDKSEDILTVINMDAVAAKAKLDLHRVVKKGMAAFTLTDLITKEIFTYNHGDLSNIQVPVNGYSTRMLLIDELQKRRTVVKEK